MDIAVLGAGAFGAALAKMFSQVGGRSHSVRLWCRNPEAACHIETQRESRNLPGVLLGPSVLVPSNLAEAVAGKPVVVGVTPSQVVREVFGRAAPHLSHDS